MLNKTILQGRLTADPELKQTVNGVNYTFFTVAWSRKDVSGQEIQCFLRCKAWKNTAEMVVKYFRKGKEIVVEGSIVTDKYTDKEGNVRSDIHCDVQQVHFCGSASDGKNAQETGSSAPKKPAMIPLEDSEDLPF